MENQINKLAKNLVNYSCKIKRGEKVLIEAGVKAEPLVIELIKEIYKVGGFPFVKLKNYTILRELLKGTSENHSKLNAKYMYPIIDDMDAYIGISASDNIFELKDVQKEKMLNYNLYYQKPIHHDIRITKTKWVILQYPTESFCQQAGKSTEEFCDFYYKVCNLDYEKMNKAMDKLKELMERTDKVKIVGKNTDLEFSIKGIKAIKCAGEMNIPDGEIYTAPIKESVNGTIEYNVPTMYNGMRFDNVSFKFENGKIIEAKSLNNTKELNEILDTDEGARFIGEFAFGVNPYILEPMLDILFDEKICGSFHFTPGSCYNDAYNGNDSAIHWDMVQIQRDDYSGGEIWFDGVLIRKNGLFVLPELLALNPENLK
ncbi:MAG: aminopeptidase [Clostridiales bacterium]|nr:aminopeptidase [Candidatus Apopatousia equi]